MQILFKKPLLLSTTVAMSLLFTGCGESKVAQCNKIITTVNKAAILDQELSKNTQTNKGTKGLTEAANKIDAIASELKAIEIKDEKLQSFQGRFLKLYQGTSQGLKDAAKAIDKKDIKSVNRNVAALKKSASDGSSLVKEINTYCTGK